MPRLCLQFTLIIGGITLLAYSGMLVFLRQQPSSAALIAYSTDTGKICLQAPTDETRRCFGGFPDLYFRPSFSPDGRWLIFHVKNLMTLEWEIRALNLHGGAHHFLTRYEETASPRPIYWFPDSTRFLLQSYTFNYFDTISPAGSATRLAWSEGKHTQDSQVTISPDSEWLAYALEPDRQPFSIYKTRLDGSETQQLSNQFDSFPIWSPDGQWIAFRSGRETGDTGIYRMRPDGGEQQLVVTGEKLLTVFFSWFPDAKSLLYITLDAKMYQVEVDGNQKRLWAENVYPWAAPAISPDGSQLVFQPDSGYGLHLINSDGTRRILTASWAEYPSWSPIIDLPYPGYLPLLTGGLCLLAAVLVRRK